MKHFDLRRRSYLKNDDLIILVDFEGETPALSDEWCGVWQDRTDRQMGRTQTERTQTGRETDRKQTGR